MRKQPLFILAIFFGLSGAIAQTAKDDITITSKYRINSIYPLGKFRLTVTLTNTSKYDYKDIAYKVEYVAGDGTVEGSKDCVFHDFIGQGVTKTLKEEYTECPKDCKSINVSIIGGKKLR